MTDTPRQGEDTEAIRYELQAAFPWFRDLSSRCQQVFVTQVADWKRTADAYAAEAGAGEEVRGD